MYSLYIDTHMQTIIIVLFKDGKILSKMEQESNMSHSVFTMPMIESIIKDNKITVDDLNEIIVVNGPGSFTGVRIGVTIAKTMAYSLDIPIKVISALEVLAVSSTGEEKIAVISDRNGKYVGKFNKENKILDDYVYIANKDFDITNYIENIELDFEKIYDYVRNIDSSNPHEVNPIYVKNIEVLNG